VTISFLLICAEDTIVTWFRRAVKPGSSEPPGERGLRGVEGARQSIRYAQQQVPAFTAQHLDELVEGLERDGEIAAANVTAAAEAVIAAHQEPSGSRAR
jgi:hypothetical protein